MLNIQPIEKRELRSDGTLSVHSIFPTIQGEGPFCGVPCVFIRLAGCNLQCPACDTDYTSGRQRMPIHDILNEVTRLRPNGGLVVITGGEPFRQNIVYLCRMLTAMDYYVQIESNGTLQPQDGIPYNVHPEQREGVYVVCSPKTGKLHPSVYDVACALKYVVHWNDMDDDGLPSHALGHPGRPARPPADWDRPIYVQPMDAKDEAVNRTNYQTAVMSCMNFGYTLQIQVHKIVGVE